MTWFRWVLIAVLLIVIAMLLYNPASARTVMAPVFCGETDKLVGTLKSKYGEVPISAGPSKTGRTLYRVFVNPITKTFTVLGTSPEGSCVVAAGVDYTATDPKESSI